MAFQLPALPSFQTNIPQQIAAMPSPLEQYGKMLQLRQLSGQIQQQQQMQPLQVQQAQQQTQLSAIQVQKAQQEQQARTALLKLMTDSDFQGQFGANQSTENGDASPIGFDPGKLLQSLAKGGVTDPDVANGFIDTMLKRSQTYAEIAKTNAQATEAQSNVRTKGLDELHKRVAAASEDPTKVPALLNDLMQNQQLFTGVPKDDLAHVFVAAQKGDIQGMKAAAGALDIDKSLADFHKTQAEAFAATPEGAAAKSGAEAQAKLNVESSPQALQLAAKKAALEANARQQAAQGDPNVAGELLANGSLTLAELKTRGTTPQFIEKATLAAQKVKPNYNPADEVIAEQVAKSQTANQFFGSANSLIAKGGTLDQLDNLGKSIPQHEMPALNTVDDWQKLARGKGPLAGYAATALGVADDYGKVMGGGTASDSARESALRLFSQASSPEQRAQAIQATRDAVQSQRDSRIGNNQFLKRQYGAEVGGTQSSGGMIRARDLQGKLHEAPKGTPLPAGWKTE